MSSNGSSSGRISDELIDDLSQLSVLLDNSLSKETISSCLNLCELGVEPESLHTLVNHLLRKRQEIQQESEANVEFS
ncbi:Mitotic-spindle organizing protein 1 [Entomophthora muscae]|uniref:Mitotic-spindle organizing protein 1 n=2 Tax=Entomophthora muscae TaxID=34485 RepID=A0ACC2TY29_9FUNG|nr:Mitotic-spindle organizing protein 1 [Entomophthora muscae]KAJ9079154.1 Mitotic-spindle organizing protein 1 [Entomophthora muscae]